MQPGIEKGRSSDRSAFRKFLNWLDLGIDSNGEKYLEIRHRLVQYFDRKNCASPDELADETLNRIARRLVEEGEIRGVTPVHYCYVVARFVFLEYQRRPDRSYVSTEVLLSLPAAYPGAPGPSELDAAEIREQRLRLPGELSTNAAGRSTGADRGILSRRARGENRTSLCPGGAPGCYHQRPQHTCLADPRHAGALCQDLLP